MGMGIFQFAVARAFQELGATHVANVEEHLKSEWNLPIDLAQVFVVVKQLRKIGYLTEKIAERPVRSPHSVRVFTLTEGGEVATTAVAEKVASMMLRER